MLNGFIRNLNGTVKQLYMKNSSSGTSKKNNLDRYQSRHARISTYKENSRGVCIYLSSDDLRLLGISVNEATHIAYQIDQEKRRINLKGTSKDGDTNQE